MSDIKTKKRDTAWPIETPTASWLGWRWIDDMMQSYDWRAAFKIEEIRDGNLLTIRAELPGIEPDRDVHISIVDDSLVIKAEKKSEFRNTNNHGYRSEFRYGSLMRSVMLPKGFKESSIQATYHDGVLEVKMECPDESVNGISREIKVVRV